MRSDVVSVMECLPADAGMSASASSEKEWRGGGGGGGGASSSSRGHNDFILDTDLIILSFFKCFVPDSLIS